MNWNNNQVLSLILDKSQNIETVRKLEPSSPTDNPLYIDSVSLKELEFAQEVRDYLDGTPLDDKDNYVSKSARVMIKGSAVNHIDLEKYEEEDIEEYREYLTQREEVREYNRTVGGDWIETIPQFAFLYDHWNGKNVLVFSNSNNNPLAVGLSEMDKLINDDIRNTTRHFSLLDSETIRDELEGIDFNSLRSRLIEAGYSSLVGQIDEQLNMY